MKAEQIDRLLDVVDNLQQEVHKTFGSPGQLPPMIAHLKMQLTTDLLKMENALVGEPREIECPVCLKLVVESEALKCDSCGRLVCPDCRGESPVPRSEEAWCEDCREGFADEKATRQLQDSIRYPKLEL
jgi:hypothetical protein